MIVALKCVMIYIQSVKTLSDRVSIMICSKCEHTPRSEIRFRCSPTFCHSQIFGEPIPASMPQPYCSATYHSTIFGDTQAAHQISRNQHKGSGCHSEKDNCHAEMGSCHAEKDSCHAEGEQRQNEGTTNSMNEVPVLQTNQNLGARGISRHDALWKNPQKELTLMNCSSSCCCRLSRQRKLIELSSDLLASGPRIAKCNCRCLHTAQPIDFPNLQEQVPNPLRPNVADQKNLSKVNKEQEQKIQIKQPVDKQQIQNYSQNQQKIQNTKPLFQQLEKNQRTSVCPKYSVYQHASNAVTKRTASKGIRNSKSFIATGQPVFRAIRRNK